MSHRKLATQYTDGVAPETNCRCFALDTRSATRKRTNDAGTNDRAMMTLMATTKSVAEFKYCSIFSSVVLLSGKLTVWIPGRRAASVLLPAFASRMPLSRKVRLTPEAWYAVLSYQANAESGSSRDKLSTESAAAGSWAPSSETTARRFFRSASCVAYSHDVTFSAYAHASPHSPDGSVKDGSVDRLTNCTPGVPGANSVAMRLAYVVL
mmetsp:Transcript_33192/g.86814  ORF Transcript_33192/g.86814 Transcript_33192/m.86814 type:complete len:209 (+) Transcript_33192:2426-3052(+)